MTDEMNKKNSEQKAATKNSKKSSAKGKKAPSDAKKKNAAAKKEHDELNEKFIRLNAEFANYKRRTDKEKGELGSFVRADLFLSLLPIKDDFDRMKEHLDQDKKNIIDGIQLISKKVDQFFEKYNVKNIKALGEVFDPELHEALMMQPVESDEEDHKIQQVLEEGYIIGEKVIRHARVVVGKKD